MTNRQASCDRFLQTVREWLGDHAVKTSPADTAPYLTDWRKRYVGQAAAVLLPATTDEVARIVALANQHQVALVPQGGNTGLSGGATPDSSGQQVVLALTRLKAVRAIDVENKTMTVEAGVSLQEVQQQAAQVNLFFPLSLGAEGTATIGGNLATNAGGTAVLRYGSARDLCLGLEVVTAQGEIWNGLRGLRKDNTGYDLRDLFIGSEGTLGIITAAVLKLFPKPGATLTAVVRLSEGPAHGLALLQIAQSAADAGLTAFEFMSAESLSLLRDRLPDVAKPLMQVAYQGDSASDCVLLEISHPRSSEQATQLLEQVIVLGMEQGLVADAILAQSQAQSQALWHARESITLASAEDGPQVKFDIALPISKLAEFISVMNAELRLAYPGIRLINFGHFGDGNLHYNVACPQTAAVTSVKAVTAGSDATDERQHRHAEYAGFVQSEEQQIRECVHGRVVAMNGSISAEHGLGQLRRDEAKKYKSVIELDLMQTIKRALDPKGILNPGKVL